MVNSVISDSWLIDKSTEKLDIIVIIDNDVRKAQRRVRLGWPGKNFNQLFYWFRRAKLGKKSLYVTVVGMCLVWIAEAAYETRGRANVLPPMDCLMK